MSYPTDTYYNLQERFKSIAGLSALETTDSSFLRQAVNRRVRTAYERYPWPDFTVIGEPVNIEDNVNGLIENAITFEGSQNLDGDNKRIDFSSTSRNAESLEDGDIVKLFGFSDTTGTLASGYINNKYHTLYNVDPQTRTFSIIVNYTGTVGVNAQDLGGLQPSSSSIIKTYGASRDTNFNANVVFRVHSSNPFTTLYPEELTFVSTISDGSPAIRIISSGRPYYGPAYVTYRKDLQELVGGSGFFGLESNDNQNIPYTFFEYAAFGAYADFLRGDGQTEKAQVEDQNAELILVAEIDKVRNQSRQFRHDVLQYRPMTQFRRHNVQAGGSPLNTSGTVFNNNVQ